VSKILKIYWDHSKVRGGARHVDEGEARGGGGNWNGELADLDQKEESGRHMNTGLD